MRSPTNSADSRFSQQDFAGALSSVPPSPISNRATLPLSENQLVQPGTPQWVEAEILEGRFIICNLEKEIELEQFYLNEMDDLSLNANLDPKLFAIAHKKHHDAHQLLLAVQKNQYDLQIRLQKPLPPRQLEHIKSFEEKLRIGCQNNSIMMSQEELIKRQSALQEHRLLLIRLQKRLDDLTAQQKSHSQTPSTFDPQLFPSVSEAHVFKKINRVDAELAKLKEHLKNPKAKNVVQKLGELETWRQKKNVLLASSKVDLSTLFYGVNLSVPRDQNLIPAAIQLLYRKLNSIGAIKGAFLSDDFGRQDGNISYSHGTHFYVMMLLALNQTLFNVMVHSPNLDEAEKNDQLNPFLKSFVQEYNFEKTNSWIPRLFQRCSMDAVLNNKEMGVTAKVKKIFDHGAYHPHSRTFKVLATMAVEQAKSTPLPYM